MKRAMMPPLPQQLLNIAQSHLNIYLTTLKSRKCDRLDFHEVSCWGIEAALKAAYELGWKVGAGKDTR
jgi:hypothetical protein